MSKITIYLAGRMGGLTKDESTEWRNKALDIIPETYKVYSPQWGADYSGNQSGKEIWTRDYYMVDNSDIILVNFDYENDNAFLGTSMEIGRAFYQNKPIIIFSSKKWVHESRTLNYHGIILNNLEEAIEYILLNYN